jgi:hypothetical protein
MSIGAVVVSQLPLYIHCKVRISVWRFLLSYLEGSMFCGIQRISGLGWSVSVEWRREYVL